MRKWNFSHFCQIHNANTYNYNYNHKASINYKLTHQTDWVTNEPNACSLILALVSASTMLCTLITRQVNPNSNQNSNSSHIIIFICSRHNAHKRFESSACIATASYSLSNFSHSISIALSAPHRTHTHTGSSLCNLNRTIFLGVSFLSIPYVCVSFHKWTIATYSNTSNAQQIGYKNRL